MARKALWIVVLVVALLAISASAVLAANVTRPAQAAVTPKTEIVSTGASQNVVKSISVSKSKDAQKKTSVSKSYGRGDCPVDDESAAAY
jgi:hypothetical protein